MSAHDQMRAMLDQLMGTARDGEENKNRVRFDDPKVCKSFLMGCCPHEILSSTRMDLGECHRMHDLALKADFEMASKDKDYYYDIDAMEHLTTFVEDCNRRTEMAKRRLKETQEELSEESNAKAEEIHQLGEKIGTKLARAEELGADGNVEESLKLMQEIEELKKEKTVIEQDYRNSMPASSYQQQKLRVCEICSAYLGIHDNDRRLADHFGGKLHLGFINIRDKLEELQKSVKDRREQREQAREERRRKEQEESDKRRAEAEERRKRRDDSRERDRERRRRRSRSRDRRRRRSRSRHRRSRSRSRSRRSRSRSRHRRSRSRSRHRRRRSRSRSRDRRSRGHRSRRSRSRSRSRRSRSKGRRRSRSRSRSRKHSRSRSKSRISRSHSRNKSVDKSNASPKQHETASATANGETTEPMPATSHDIGTAEAPEGATDVNNVAMM